MDETPRVTTPANPSGATTSTQSLAAIAEPTVRGYAPPSLEIPKFDSVSDAVFYYDSVPVLPPQIG